MRRKSKRARQLAIQAARSESRFLHQWVQTLNKFRTLLESLGDRNPLHVDDVRFAIKELDIEIAELKQEEDYWIGKLDEALYEDADARQS